MMQRMALFFTGVLGLVMLAAPATVRAHGHIESEKEVRALVDVRLLKMMNVPILAQESSIGVGYAILSPEKQMELSTLAHQFGKCGGFEALPENADIKTELLGLNQLARLETRNQQMKNISFLSTPIEKNEKIETALVELKEDNLRETVTWLSSFNNRYNKGSNANVPVLAMQEKLQKWVAEWNAQKRWNVSIELISHASTPQKSIRVHLEGSTRPSEIVVIGGHFDSIAGWGGSSARAPGVDDNASGSSNILEALRVLLSQEPTERSIDFFWYAGEESGLLGSNEIARSYKQQNKNVVGVLQLDMTLFPGEGEFVIGNVSDFTNASLRDYLEKMNEIYLKVRIVEDRCGYACSDHASWFKQGYATLMPFEATTRTMNDDIHTDRDLITPALSFRHSLVFSKIALVFAMDLGNSSFIPQM